MEEEAEDVVEEEETVDEEEEGETVDEEEEETVDEEEGEAVEGEEEETVDEEEVEEESVDEEMEFDSAFTAKTENGFRFSLQNATVNVSTVMAMFVMAMVVLMARCCFWKMYGEKVAKRGVPVNYGTVTETIETAV